MPTDASAPGSRHIHRMLGIDFSGMVRGMVASVALYRMYFRARPMDDLSFNRSGGGMP